MTQPVSVIVSSTTDSPTILQKAGELAARLNLKFSPTVEGVVSQYLLNYSKDGLQLVNSSVPPSKRRPLLYVDFVGGKNGYRLAKNCTIKQPLARAVGIKPGFRPTVFDATAGLGGDGFVLASLGCQVTMCERSPLLGALLEDGLERALHDKLTEIIVSKRLHLFIQDSRDFLHRSQTKFHTIYLDPMYPHRKQSALNKQALRVIRHLVGDDVDGDSLLEAACKKAVNRVVVKRPAGAPNLAAMVPTHTIAMKNSRFDVYLTNDHVSMRNRYA